MSVGVIRDIRYQPEEYIHLGVPDVNDQDTEVDEHGDTIIKGVIHWLMNAVCPA